MTSSSCPESNCPLRRLIDATQTAQGRRISGEIANELSAHPGILTFSCKGPIVIQFWFLKLRLPCPIGGKYELTVTQIINNDSPE